jgi:hypothetical protein
VNSKSGVELPATFAAQESPFSPVTVGPESDQSKVSDSSDKPDFPPATIAAGSRETESQVASAEPRWMAVPVAIGSDETDLSLEQEMEKSRLAMAVAASAASFAAADRSLAGSFSAAPFTSVPDAPRHFTPESSFSAAVAEAEAAASETVATPASFAAPHPETTSSAPAAQPSSASAAQAFPANDHWESSSKASEEAGFREPGPRDLAAPISREGEKTETVAPEPVATTSEPEPESSRTAAEVASVGSKDSFPKADCSPTADSLPMEGTRSGKDTSEQPEAAQLEAGSGKDSDLATHAAAWASWRQIRDADHKPKFTDVPAAKDSIGEDNVTAPSDTAAAAVAAGAEKILQEASAASPGADPTAIASIVESVLADLRPKIVEEISRKLSQKK